MNGFLRLSSLAWNFRYFADHLLFLVSRGQRNPGTDSRIFRQIPNDTRIDELKMPFCRNWNGFFRLGPSVAVY